MSQVDSVCAEKTCSSHMCDTSICNQQMLKRSQQALIHKKASCSDCIPVVVLKKCEPELSYILAKFFNMCLKESCFPDCWKASLVVPVFQNVGERYTAKNYCPVINL